VGEGLHEAMAANLFPPTARTSSQVFTDVRVQLKCDGTRAETRFRLSAKRTSPFKLAGASVQSTTGSRGVRISDSNAGYTMLRGSVKGTGYPLHSPDSPSLPLPCGTVCHHILTGVYNFFLCRSLPVPRSFSSTLSVGIRTENFLFCSKGSIPQCMSYRLTFLHL